MSVDTDMEDSALTTSQDTEKAYPPDKSLGRWFLWVSILVVFLVVIGGIVRLTDSGLSIPEWPIINGSLLPPVTDDDWEAVYKTYHSVIEGVEVDSVYHNAYPGIIPIGRFKQMFALEYFHRFVAAVLGILYLVLLIKVMRRREIRSRFGVRMWIGLALLILQAVMGGIVVKYDLQAEFLAVHLGLAFALFGLLYWTSMSLLRPPDEHKTYYNKFLSRIAWSGVAALFLQVLSGAVMAGTKAGLSWNTWPLIGDHLIPPPSVMWRSYMGILNFIHNTVLVQFIHRWWAFAALIVIVFLVFYSLKFKVTPRCRIAFRVITSVVALQIILGIITLLTKVPPTLGVLHLTLGIILFGNMLYIT
ncbi:MAG TPA: heme A synthase, partial [candidate division Zixibacteria bacterium]|nr:heme A synthase [candidate division Zixibacteria bacterium]